MSKNQTTNLISPQPLHGGEDNGINVLLDHAHQFLFFTAWDIPPLLREGGFRIVGSQATLDTVLAPGQPSRVRLGEGKKRPFGWWPNPEFNVVITYQNQPQAQEYLPEEITATQTFVEEGGGLVIIGGALHSSDDVKRWPINSLAKRFGADFSADVVPVPFVDAGNSLTKPLELPASFELAALSLDKSWSLLICGSDAVPILAIREFGKGRVVIISNLEMIKWGKDSAKNKTTSKAANGTFLHNVLRWVAANKLPAGGSRNLPCEAWGGGAIYPEQQIDIGGITVLYAKNQKEAILKVTSEDMPSVKGQLEAWLPSVPPPDGMYLILASGAGGGWAVNVYEPKEVGTIALEPEGILSVFAHELAHTMAGPPNDNGEVAGRLPSLFSEAHAGWFQGKIAALRTGSRGGHEPNLIFEVDGDGKTIDITIVDESWKGWRKLWWIMQKMDDRYGTTWYPRWLWVKNVRWQNEPNRQLSWDDVVEDMSIAVREDLFPFFREIGTTLDKERCPTALFMGETIGLDVAPITVTNAGKARFEPIGDYKQAESI